MMGIRRKVIAYSRGNDLGFFWEFYRWQKKVKKGFLFDILTFFMSRSAHNHWEWMQDLGKTSPFPTASMESLFPGMLLWGTTA